MKIINHLLYKDDGQPYPSRESPNHGKQMQPEYLVMHFTAGRNCQSSTDWLCNPESNASAHLVICRDGSITQLVPFNVIAWHAGRSLWRGVNMMNRYSIGIEMENMGELKQESDGYHPWYHYAYNNWKSRKTPSEKYPPVSDNDVLKDTPHQFEPSAKRNWHRYTKEQLDAAFEVALLLVQTYQLKEILGHDDITRKTTRKVDSGPGFPMDKLRAFAYSYAPSPVSEIYQVIVDSLNIRQGPHKEYDAIGNPLPQGTRVQILEISDENPRWKRVDVLDDDRIGWVNSAPVNSPPTLEKVTG